MDTQHVQFYLPKDFKVRPEVVNKGDADIYYIDGRLFFIHTDRQGSFIDEMTKPRGLHVPAKIPQMARERVGTRETLFSNLKIPQGIYDPHGMKAGASFTGAWGEVVQEIHEDEPEGAQASMPSGMYYSMDWPMRLASVIRVYGNRNDAFALHKDILEGRIRPSTPAVAEQVRTPPKRVRNYAAPASEGDMRNPDGTLQATESTYWR